MQIIKRDLWRDGIHLQESDKTLLKNFKIAKNFINSINKFLSKTQSQGPGVQHSV